MSTLPKSPLPSFVKRNPHLYQQVQVTIPNECGIPVATAMVAKRIRQSSKPVMNKLEARFAVHFAALNPEAPRMVAQGMRVQLARGAWYKVDFYIPALKIAHEVKGPRVMKNQQSRQMLALKVAAAAWPEITWYLNWFEDGEWRQQEVLA